MKMEKLISYLKFISLIWDKFKEKIWNSASFWKLFVLLLILAIGFGWYLGTGELSLSIRVGDREAIVGGQIIQLTGTPTLIDNELYVPARSIFEALGATIEYDQESQRAWIKIPKTVIKY